MKIGDFWVQIRKRSTLPGQKTSVQNRKGGNQPRFRFLNRRSAGNASGITFGHEGDYNRQQNGRSGGWTQFIPSGTGVESVCGNRPSRLRRRCSPGRCRLSLAHPGRQVSEIGKVDQCNTSDATGEIAIKRRGQSKMGVRCTDKKE